MKEENGGEPARASVGDGHGATDANSAVADVGGGGGASDSSNRPGASAEHSGKDESGRKSASDYQRPPVSADGDKPDRSNRSAANGEHAPVLRTWLLGATLVANTFALLFTAMSVREQTAQMQLASDDMAASAWQGLSKRGDNLVQIFVEHPELRPFFYSSAPIPQDDPNYHRVMAVSELYLDYIEAFQDDYVMRLPGMETDGEFRRAWDAFFSDLFSASPALVAYAMERKEWYSTDFSKYFPKQETKGQGG